MNRALLTLRINRRAIGAVVLDNEALAFTEGRHLTSRPDKTLAAASRFVESVLSLTNPKLLVVDAPAKEGSIVARIRTLIDDLITRYGFELLPVSKPEILAAYGLKGLRNRRELRELIRQYWPELGNVRGKIEPYVVDAAAAALYADCRINLERVVS